MNVVPYATAKYATSITAHDTNANQYDAIWVGVGGNIAVQLRKDTSSIVFTNVPVGWFSVSTSLVLSTGTTASALIGVRW